MSATPHPGSPGQSDGDEDDREVRERQLLARERELTERERQAREGAPDPAVLSRLADERDALMQARDELAGQREQDALARRGRALGREVAAADRDRRRRQEEGDDRGFVDRFLAGRDVDAAAGDRADALDDERHSRADRSRAATDRQRAEGDRRDAAQAAVAAADEAAAASAAAAERASADRAHLQAGLSGRTTIGQAQGLLMAEHSITADEAFELLVRQSQTLNVKLRDVAQALLDRHRQDQPPR